VSRFITKYGLPAGSMPRSWTGTTAGCSSTPCTRASRKKPRDRVIVAVNGAQQLDRDVAVDPRVASDPDLAHPSAAEDRAEVVALAEVRDRRPPRRAGVIRGSGRVASSRSLTARLANAADGLGLVVRAWQHLAQVPRHRVLVVLCGLGGALPDQRDAGEVQQLGDHGEDRTRGAWYAASDRSPTAVNVSAPPSEWRSTARCLPARARGGCRSGSACAATMIHAGCEVVAGEDPRSEPTRKIGMSNSGLNTRPMTPSITTLSPSTTRNHGEFIGKTRFDSARQMMPVSVRAEQHEDRPHLTDRQQEQHADRRDEHERTRRRRTARPSAACALARRRQRRALAACRRCLEQQAPEHGLRLHVVGIERKGAAGLAHRGRGGVVAGGVDRGARRVRVGLCEVAPPRGVAIAVEVRLDPVRELAGRRALRRIRVGRARAQIIELGGRSATTADGRSSLRGERRDDASIPRGSAGLPARIS